MSAEHPFDWETYRAAEFAGLPRDPYQDPEERIIDQAEAITLVASLELSNVPHVVRMAIVGKRKINEHIDATLDNLGNALVDWGDADETSIHAAEVVAQDMQLHKQSAKGALTRIRSRFHGLPPQLLGNPPRRTRMYDYDQFRKQQ